MPDMQCCLVNLNFFAINLYKPFYCCRIEPATVTYIDEEQQGLGGTEQPDPQIPVEHGVAVITEQARYDLYFL
jgi:hypothetical protein